jgi:hypothetical protein
LRAEKFLPFLGRWLFLFVEPAVAVLVVLFHERLARSTKSFWVESPRPTFTWASTGPAFTGSSAWTIFTGASTRPTFARPAFAWPSTRATFAWSSTWGTSAAQLGTEKILQLFGRGEFFVADFSIAILIKFLDEGFLDVLTSISAAPAFAGAATLCLC